jgi:hypothetical protein
MAVKAVQSSEYRNNSCLSNVVNGTAGGAVLGYAAKYALPLTHDELATLNAMEISECAKKSAIKQQIVEFEKLAMKTPAQDAFVKQTSLKEVANAPYKNEYKEILKRVNKVAEEQGKKLTKYKKWDLKLARPGAQFAAIGAGVGLIVGITRNVFRTNVEAQG